MLNKMSNTNKSITFNITLTYTLDFDEFFERFYDNKEDMKSIAEKVWSKMVEETGGEANHDGEAEYYDIGWAVDSDKENAEELLEDDDNE